MIEHSPSSDCSPAPNPDEQQITILGVGNILLSDEGAGVRVIEHLDTTYRFTDNVQLVDGGVLGMRLLGIVSESDILIVVDAVQNRQPPGTLYRLAGDQVPRRVLAKQSMHQMDLPEVLALSSAIGKPPKTIVIGVEPQDISTFQVALTPIVGSRIEDLADMVLDELKQLKIPFTRKRSESA